MSKWMRLSFLTLIIMVCLGLVNHETEAAITVDVSASPVNQTTETDLNSLTVYGSIGGVLYGTPYSYKWVYADDWEQWTADSTTYDWGSLALSDEGIGGENLVDPSSPVFQNNGDYYLLMRAKDDNSDDMDYEVYGPYNIKVDNTYIHIVASSNTTHLTTDDALDVTIDVTMPSNDFSVVQSVYYEWDGIFGADITSDIQSYATTTISGLMVNSGDVGTHRLDVSLETTGAETKSVSYYYEFDDTPPVVSLTPDASPGTGEQAHSVTVNLDGSDVNDRYYVSNLWSPVELDLLTDTIIWPDPVEQAGNQSYSTPAGMDGTYYYYVKVSDQAGNVVTEAVTDPFLLDNSPPELSLINGQAPACEAEAGQAGTVIDDCTSNASSYAIPISPFFVNLVIDGNSGAELAGYTIQYHVVEIPTLYNWLDTAEWLDGGVYSDTGLFQLGGYLYSDPIHERYVQFLIEDPAGNQKLYLSDKFTIDPAYRPKFVVYPESTEYIKDSTLNVQVFFKHGDDVSTNMSFKFALSTDAHDATSDEYITQEVTGLSLLEEHEYFTGYYSANVQLDLSSWDLQENVEYDLDAQYVDSATGYTVRPMGPYFYYDVTAPEITSINYDPPYDPDTANFSTVTATVYYSDTQMLSNGDTSNWDTYTFTSNGTRAITIQDAAGNTASTTLAVNWIQSPYTVTYSPTPGAWTNHAVTATVEFESPVTFDGTSEPSTQHEYTINENGTFTFGFMDEADVAGEVVLAVDWIDRSAPTGSIFYEVNNAEHGITATVVATDDSGEAPVQTDADGNTIAADWTHTFTANGSYPFYFKDAADNIGSVIAEISSFDTTPPVLSVIYSATKLTNTSVRATVKANEPITVINNGGSIYYDFVQNGTFTFDVEDRFGNASSMTATVENIDKVAPVAIITYSTTDTTKEDVVATVSIADEDGAFSVSNNYGRKSYLFTKNGTFTFILVDPAGNRTEAVATVANIDKSKVAYTLTYSESDLTTHAVTVTVVAEAGKTLYFADNGGSSSVTFESNGIQWLRATDDLNNVYWIQLMVQWIDKEAPRISIDKDYIMAQNGTIPDLESGVRVTDNFNEYTLTYTNNINPAIPGNYMVTYTATDTIGNVAAATRTVEVIQADELMIYVNGQLMSADQIVNLNTDNIEVKVYGTRGEWELQGGYGQFIASHFKSGRYVLEPDQDIEVNQQGYYTIFARDQELQQLVIQIYIIPQKE